MSATEHIVVDIGNTRMKWGRVEGDRVVEKVALNYDDEGAWQKVARDWRAAPGLTKWTYAHVFPEGAHRLFFWLAPQGYFPQKLTQDILPLKVDVEHPERVGMDRLLNALALPSSPSIVISAGTAVTVDAVSTKGHFLGGVIFPGIRLMAEALHQQTAQLPRVDVCFPPPALPAKNTTDAINAGVVYAVVGGIVACHAEMVSKMADQTTTYITGGDGPALRPYLPFPTIDAPLLTLQGILNAARTLWP